MNRRHFLGCLVAAPVAAAAAMRAKAGTPAPLSVLGRPNTYTVPDDGERMYGLPYMEREPWPMPRGYPPIDEKMLGTLRGAMNYGIWP